MYRSFFFDYCYDQQIHFPHRQGKVCLYLFVRVFGTVRLLNLSWIIVNRSHVCNLRADENELSPALLVAGFTGTSLLLIMTSSFVMVFSEWHQNEISKQFIKTLKISTFQKLYHQHKVQKEGRGRGAPAPWALPLRGNLVPRALFPGQSQGKAP